MFPTNGLFPQFPLNASTPWFPLSTPRNHGNYTAVQSGSRAPCVDSSSGGVSTSPLNHVMSYSVSRDSGHENQHSSFPCFSLKTWDKICQNQDFIKMVQSYILNKVNYFWIFWIIKACCVLKPSQDFILVRILHIFSVHEKPALQLVVLDQGVMAPARLHRLTGCNDSGQQVIAHLYPG